MTVSKAKFFDVVSS